MEIVVNALSQYGRRERSKAFAILHRRIDEVFGVTPARIREYRTFPNARCPNSISPETTTSSHCSRAPLPWTDPRCE